MVAMTQEREQFLTVREIADRMRVTEYTVRNWLRSGRLLGYRPGGTKAGWRIKESDLDRFIRESRSETAAVTEIRQDMTERRAALDEQRRDQSGERQ